MTIQPGSRLGPYEISARIGAGGMGEVYRGRDTRLDRSVAIKILPPEFAADASLKLRFDREARLISQLSHPNICTLFDVGETPSGRDGEMVRYLVMEYLEGESLAERLSRGPLPVAEVLKVGVQIAGALDRAHRQGIIHRDLKPGNIMLTKGGAKLLDFGLARDALAVTAPASFANSPTEAKPLTQEGTIVGTFQYMSPEQLEGEEADARSDIFALGAVLYEMATGTRAFPSKSKTSLIAAIVSGSPTPVSQLQPLVPPGLEHIIDKCLAKDRDDRWQSAHDIAEELRWISEAGSQAGVATPIVARRKHREWLAWSLAALALIGAISATAVFMKRTIKAERIIQASLVPPPGLTFSFEWAGCGSLTVSPDSRYVTFAAQGEHAPPQLWLRPIDSLLARPLPGTVDASFPFWSPDSTQIAFFQDGKLKKIGLDGAPPITICDAPRGRNGSWNKDGVIIFSPAATTPIFKVAASGGKAEPITVLDAAAHETTHRWATFLPDGDHFIYMAGTHSAGVQSETNAVYVGSLSSKERKLILRARSNVQFAGGYLFYVREKVLLAQRFDPKKLAVQGDGIPVGQQIEYEPNFFRAVFDASEDVLVYQDAGGEQEYELKLYDRDGKPFGAVGTPANIEEACFSPDGKRIAATVLDPSSEMTDIWVYDVTRNTSSRLTFGELNELAPVWSPDGSRIAYSSVTKSADDLYLKPSTGGTEELLYKSEEEDKHATSWSPDGRYIVFNSEPDDGKGVVDVWLFDLSTRKAFPLIKTQFAESGAQVSPDGRWLLYTSNQSGQDRVYLTTFPTPGQTWEVATGFAPTWTRGGKEIAYVSTEKGPSFAAVDCNLDRATPEFGTPKNIGPPTVRTRGGAISNDGSRFVLVTPSTTDAPPPVTMVTDWRATLQRKR